MSATVPSTSPSTQREPRSFLPLFTLVNFGLYLALMTPIMVSMTFRVKHVLGEGVDAAGSLGLVLALGAVVSLFANPLCGRLSDRTRCRWGMRRPWILGGSIAGFLSLMIIAWAPNVAVIALGWCITQAAYNAALAAVVASMPDQVPHGRRGKISGWLGIASPLATLIGTVVVSRTDSDAVRFLLPGGIGLACTLLFVFTMHDRVHQPGPRASLRIRDFLGTFVFNPVRFPDLGWAWLVRFLVMFGYTGINTYLPLYLGDHLGLSESQTTSTIATIHLITLVFLVITSVGGGFLSDRLGRRRPLVAGAGIILAVGLVGLALAPSVAGVYVAEAVIGLGAGAFLSVDMALMTQVLPNEQDTAKNLGILNIANSLPQSIAPAIAPAIVQFGAATALGGYPMWFLVGGIAALAGSVLVYRIRGVR